MQKTANKQKRITLKTVHQMLDGMSVELAEKVHLLFMANYIDYSDYDFRDENQVEGYCWCYRDLFELKTKEAQEIVNSQVIEFLDEWRQDAPSRYREAKDDICYWITDEWYNFESPMQKEIESAYQAALKKKDDMAIALALSPFAQKTAELVNSGAYEAAAASCYTIFRCLAKTCKEHEDWQFRFQYEPAMEGLWKLKLVNCSPEEKETAKMLKTEEVYKPYANSEVKDILDFAYKNTPEYLLDLRDKVMKAYGGSISKEHAYRMVFGTEMNASLYNDRPLSKMKKDVLMQLQEALGIKLIDF